MQFEVEEVELVCPVCRVKQTAQPLCRRCGADLKLLIKTLHSLKAARLRVAASRGSGETAYQAALSYLRWLSPPAAHAISDQPAPTQPLAE